MKTVYVSVAVAVVAGFIAGVFFAPVLAAPPSDPFECEATLARCSTLLHRLSKTCR